MNIAIIGSGYVGLTTGVCLADLGHQVICIDNDPEKLKKLAEGISPIFEPGLQDLMKKNLSNKSLRFSDDIDSAVKESAIIFICVNTPPKTDGQADLKYVEQVARTIAQSLDGDYKVIVDKSTVPVKTAEKLKETILTYSPQKTNFDVVSNPEFLREGMALKDTLEPDRLVIGVDSEAAKEKMLELYRPLLEKTKAEVRIVSVRSAELIKHGANSFLATKISFANLIAEVCEKAGANALEVLEAIGLDKRIGNQFLNPGVGFGGSCFPKDIAAFKKTMEDLGVDNTLIGAVEDINKSAQKRFLTRIEKELWVVEDKIIGILGLAFKPDTDDIRNAPSLKIIEKLKADGAKIKAYDPQAMDRTKKIFPDIEYVNDPYEVANGASALLIITEWEQFKNLDLEKIKAKMQNPLIFDGRNAIDANQAKKLGFKYFGVGR